MNHISTASQSEQQDLNNSLVLQLDRVSEESEESQEVFPTPLEAAKWRTISKMLANGKRLAEQAKPKPNDVLNGSLMVPVIASKWQVKSSKSPSTKRRQSSVVTDTQNNHTNVVSRRQSYPDNLKTEPTANKTGSVLTPMAVVKWKKKTKPATNIKPGDNTAQSDSRNEYTGSLLTPVEAVEWKVKSKLSKVQRRVSTVEITEVDKTDVKSFRRTDSCPAMLGINNKGSMLAASQTSENRRSKTKMPMNKIASIKSSEDGLETSPNAYIKSNEEESENQEQDKIEAIKKKLDTLQEKDIECVSNKNVYDIPAKSVPSVFNKGFSSDFGDILESLRCARY